MFNEFLGIQRFASFCSAGDDTHGLVQAREVHYHWTVPPACCIYILNTKNYSGQV